MAFFNSDPASCGPSSSVSKLTSFANSKNNVLSNEYNPNVPSTSRSKQFHNNHLNTLDRRLENQFSSFMNNDTKTSIVGNMVDPRKGINDSLVNQKYRGPANVQHDWIKDFSQMSVSQHDHSVHISKMNSQSPLPQFSHSQQQLPSHHAPAMSSQQNQIRIMHHSHFLQNQSMPIFQNTRAEVNQAYNSENPQQLENEDDIFEQAFSNIEKEIALQGSSELVLEPLAQDIISVHPENEVLSNIASKIAETMEHVDDLNTDNNSELSPKFQNSKFLKLMKDISNKKVALCESGKKFIDTSTGDNINGLEADEVLFTAPQAAAIASERRLGDPLDCLNDGDVLVSSDQARALIKGKINGQNILPRSSSEIFSDYLNDDDSF
ncbi:hypothetical protein DASC09_012710 [Saccharomycopsis crataegensis]|uniref:PEX18/PEX21 C-terminal domain-containing protein n=1 Tax=Saccharomycopsis crataegensis TaxID=43959 RepID=A0AAV5QH57_9ASCO|nr:hypothetical protein DASC09_012710 [Saccharomycopsis crataegensis]